MPIAGVSSRMNATVLALLGATLLCSSDASRAQAQSGPTAFDPKLLGDLPAAEVVFLGDLFALSDEIAELNGKAKLWFASAGALGLHAGEYIEGVEELLVHIPGLNTPPRLASVEQLVGQSLGLQLVFVRDWHDALRSGRTFESQLTDEFGYQESLHRSRRLLLQAYAELRALLPDEAPEVHRSFRDHLRAMDFH